MSSKQIVTRSQTKAKLAENQPASDICVCPDSHPMDAKVKEEFQSLLDSFASKVRGDIDAYATQQKTELDALKSRFDKKPANQSLKPDIFDGNPITDAVAWLDNFRRIAKLNNWTAELQLNAFPLYLRGIAHAWFIALPSTVSGNLTELLNAFQERFASGPQDWILSQQLGARKHVRGEPIDDYIADITRLCKRLNLSDKETMRYFIEGLQGDLQAYVSLGRPTTFQEAEALARMKDIVNKRQGVVDTQSVLTQMQTMFSKLMDQTSNNNKVIAATAQAPSASQSIKKLDELSAQMKQLQKQHQQSRQQQLNRSFAMAAYDQPPGPSRPIQNGHWQAPQTRQIEQLQQQVSRLESDLRLYQNPRYPGFRSYEPPYSNREGDYNRDSFPSAYQPRTPLIASEAWLHFSHQSEQEDAY